MSFDHEPVYDEELYSANPEIERNDADDDEEKAPPPLYICIHRNDPRCNDLHPHPPDPEVYYNVTDDTPCLYCSHTGTLRQVNKVK
jgi:hypothetical protein